MPEFGRGEGRDPQREAKPRRKAPTTDGDLTQETNEPAKAMWTSSPTMAGAQVPTWGSAPAGSENTPKAPTDNSSRKPPTLISPDN